MAFNKLVFFPNIDMEIGWYGSFAACVCFGVA